MQLIYDGKTKCLLRVGGRTVLRFKDTITGDAEGNPDPGGDFVAGSIEGKGIASARVAAHLFELLEKGGVSTHFRGVSSEREIEIAPTERIPLEVIYRSKAYGSFLRRYRGYVEPLSSLDLVEFNLKDDALKDPLLSPDVVAKLGLARAQEIEQMKAIARKVATILREGFGKRGLELVDMKLEFGRLGGGLVVIDELSGDTMRVFDAKEKKLLNQIELAEALGLA